MNPIVWIDLETTGLDPRNGSILEVAVVTTDENLDECGPPAVTVVEPLSGLGREAMDYFVHDMYTKNGLIADLYVDETMKLKADLPQLKQVEKRLIDLFVVKPRSLTMAGSSIHFDRAWIEEHMPDFIKLFSHRMIDVSSITELAKRWKPEIYKGRPGLDAEGKPVPAHRALDDIRASIETLRYYRTTGFIG